MVVCLYPVFLSVILYFVFLKSVCKLTEGNREIVLLFLLLSSRIVDTSDSESPSNGIFSSPHSLHPSLKVNGVVWLGSISLFRICIEYEGD